MKQIAHNEPHSLLRKLLHFSGDQQKNYLGWVGASMMIQTTFLFPLTIFIISVTGGSFLLVLLAAIVITGVLISDLVSFSTRYIIPVFLSAVLAEVCIMIASIIIQ